MPIPDITLDLPNGWTLVDSAPDAVRFGDGTATLDITRIDAPVAHARSQVFEESLRALAREEQGTLAGTSSGEITYGRYMRGAWTSEANPIAVMWLIFGEVRDSLVAFYSGPGGLGLADKIIASLKPGLFTNVIAAMAGRVDDELQSAKVAKDATLLVNPGGELTLLDTGLLHDPMLVLAFVRHQRQRAGATVVARVRTVTHATDGPSTLIYVETVERARCMRVANASRRLFDTPIADDELTEFFVSGSRLN